MANIMTIDDNLLDQAEEVKEAFKDIIVQYSSLLNTYQDRLKNLKTTILKQCQYFLREERSKTPEVSLREIHYTTLLKQANEIRSMVLSYYKEALTFYYQFRENVTGEKITNTVYVTQKSKGGQTKTVEYKDIPLELFLENINFSLNVPVWNKDEQELRGIVTKISVPYKGFVTSLQMLQQQSKVKSRNVSKLFNKVSKAADQSQSYYNAGNVGEAVNEMLVDKNLKQAIAAEDTKTSLDMLERAKQNYLSGLLGGDVGNVQVKVFNDGSGVQLPSLNNITTKLNQMQRKMNDIIKNLSGSDRVLLQKIKQFLGLFFQDFYSRMDDKTNAAILDTIDNMILKRGKGKR